jgi:hypothetical protein
VAIARNTVAVAAAATLTLLGVALGQRPAGASPHQAASAAQAQKVIVVLRDQLSATPATRAGMNTRSARATVAQNSVLSHLAGPSATHLRHFALANAFAATVTTDQVAALQHDPSVAAVVKDASVPMPSPAPQREAGGGATGGQVQPADDGPNAICPSDPAQPLLEPEALQSIHALTTDGSPNAQQLSTGSGVTVAYIADGIDPDNPDFIRADNSHVITDYQDFSGDGPNAPSGGAEAFGDASSIAAQGTVAHDLSNFVNQAYPLPPGCNIRIVGVAPDANIVALKAGGEFLTNSAILQSIDYAVRVAHVDVINESFGLSSFPDESNRNAIELFNDQAVAAGVTVTESTGDGGINGTIGSDAPDPQVISVGATTNGRLYEQTGYAGARFFSNGRWVNDNISALSSAGTTQNGRTQDLVAPGEGNWAVCEPGFLSCLTFRSPGHPGGRPVLRRDERVGAAHGGCGSARHLGIPLHARRLVAVAGGRQTDHHRHCDRPRAAAGRAGRWPAQRAGGNRDGPDLARRHRSTERCVEHRGVRRPGDHLGYAQQHPRCNGSGDERR